MLNDTSPNQDRDCKETECYQLQDSCEHSAGGKACEDCVFFGASMASACSAPPSMSGRLGESLRKIARSPDRFRSTPMNEDDELSAGLPFSLADTFVEMQRPRPLPDGLRNRLQGIARATGSAHQSRPAERLEQLSPWLADSRWVSAACALLTAGLTLMAGDASARFQEIQASSSQIQQTAVALTATAGHQVAQRTAVWNRLPSLPTDRDAWIPNARLPPTPDSSELGGFDSMLNRGIDYWTAIQERASSHIDHLVGISTSRAQALNDFADAWFDINTEKDASLSQGQLRELRLRAEDAWHDSTESRRQADSDMERKDP